MVSKKTSKPKRLTISFFLDPDNPHDLALARLLEGLNPKIVSQKSKPAVFRVLRTTANDLLGKTALPTESPEDSAMDDPLPASQHT